jgi:hypothetical protein
MIELTWGEFKNLVLTHDLLRCVNYVDLGRYYLLWVSVENVLFRCQVYKNSFEASEFEVLRDKIPVQERYDEVGRRVLARGLSVLPGNTVWAGAMNGVDFRFGITAGVENFFDMQLDRNKFLWGGRYVIVDEAAINVNDYVELSIIDKDNVLGLFDVYGVPPGGFLELKKFVKKWWVYKTPVFEFVSEDATYLLQGLYIRCGYRSFGTVDNTLLFTLYFFEDV